MARLDFLKSLVFSTLTHLDQGGYVVLDFTTNPFGGVLLAADSLPPDIDEFHLKLDQSIRNWRLNGYKVVWIEIPIEKALLIPAAAGTGFLFHHASEGSIMMFLRLVEDAFIPPFASHYVGVGGVVVNDLNNILVVRERLGKSGESNSFKLPGGTVYAGEHLSTAVEREVLEETGIRAKFKSIVCFRNQHEYRHGKSDIYFVCHLKPLSHDIAMQVEEIAECKWMPLADYLNSLNVSTFNKTIVEVAVRSAGLNNVHLEGYDDTDKREFFMPNLGN